MTRSMCPRGIGRLLEGENGKREGIDLDNKDLDDEVLDVEDEVEDLVLEDLVFNNKDRVLDIKTSSATSSLTSPTSS